MRPPYPRYPLSTRCEVSRELVEGSEGEGQASSGASDSLVAGRCFHRPLRGWGMPHKYLTKPEVADGQRNLILNARAENQIIGYIEGTEAFDLMGNKRCNYNPSTGNLVEPDSSRIIGHVSLAGYFVGESWIADELFAGRVGKNAPIPLRAQLDAAASLVPTNSLHEPTTDRAESLATTKLKEATETPLSIDAPTRTRNDSSYARDEVNRPSALGD